MQPIQWYPGHIAKAERELKNQLKLVDVVLEVRDARIPLTSCHPKVRQWIGDKPRLLVLNRQDTIPKPVRQEWRAWFESQGEIPYFTNAKRGQGIKAVVKATQTLGTAMNERRHKRGMMPRPVRAVVMGFPNVGKSALINRLVGQKVVESARRAGVTRQLRWVRISEAIELLDAPGVIPSRLEDAAAAIKLAICEDIGDAAYDNQRIAAAFVELLVELDLESLLAERYELPVGLLAGDEYVHQLSALRDRGDLERTARRLLDDFRKGLLGALSLEYPPE
ncbi:MAG: ribosome biogenesis GTPase YlqF [Cyanobacteria bacterium J06641_5]